MALKGPSSFPEMPRSDQSADEGGKPAFIGRSEQVGVGHCDSPGRMPPITNDEFPNSESGEGKGSK